MNLEFAKYLKIRKSRIHGRGMFTDVDLPKGIDLIEYVGERITKAEGDRRADRQMARAQKINTGSVYLFELNVRYYIDGNVNHNRARLINHSCRPNCEVDIKRGRILISSKKKIFAGEELTYDYGFDIEDYQDHRCRCGHPKCFGFIVSNNRKYYLKSKLKKQKLNCKASILQI